MEHTENMMIFSSSIIEHMSTGKLENEIEAKNRYYSMDELLLSKVAHTASFMMRKSRIKWEYLGNDHVVFGGDVVLALNMAQEGRVFGISNYDVVYRKHDKGISTSELKNKGIAHFEKFLRQFLFIKSNFPELKCRSSSLKIMDTCMTLFKLEKNNRSLYRYKYLLLTVYYKLQCVIRRN